MVNKMSSNKKYTNTQLTGINGLLMTIYLLLLGTSCNEFLDEVPDNRVALDDLDKAAQVLTNAYSISSYAFNDWMTDNSGFIRGIIIRPAQEDLYMWEDVAQTIRTFSAAGPLSPWTVSNSTFWPSFNVLNPSIAMDEWWTKRSLEPSSGVMKPKPLLSLNHFTVPCVICVLTFLACWASSPGAPLPLRERQEPLEATCATLLANAGKSTGGYCEVAKFLGGYRSGQEGSTGHHGVSAHASSPAASPHSEPVLQGNGYPC